MLLSTVTPPTKTSADMAEPLEETPLPDIRPRAAAAMLAAACGDALGWPVEPRGARVGGTRGLRPSLEFFEWHRREGGRYAPHERTVPAGTYSDDTQLMLAVGRSLSAGADWWRHYTDVELPMWATYELGGGGAVKRAANSWGRRVRPWSSRARPKDRRRYFEAGANGVVMRTLPHAIHGARNPFELVARTVMADGITTHGHPRALVSALALAYAQWRALRRQDPALGYGELVDETIQGVSEWARLPRVDDVAPDWARCADLEFPSDYTRLWDHTVEEMIGLLDTCRAWLRKGSLARDQDALEDLGAYGREGGSGTRTAAAGVYFAARYAARPPAGLLAAAFAYRTDSDTIACVTGSLLGALTGVDWLRGISKGLMDSRYIGSLGTALAIQQPTVLTTDTWIPNLKRKLLDSIAESEPGQSFRIPVFGRAYVHRTEAPPTRSANHIGIYWLETEIGQTLAFTKVSKVGGSRPKSVAPQQTTIEDDIPLDVARPARPAVHAIQPTEVEGESPTSRVEHENQPRPDGGVFTLMLLASDLDRSVHLYRDILRLPLGRRTEELAVFGRNLALVRDQPRPGGKFRNLPRPGDPQAFETTQVMGVVMTRRDAMAAHLALREAGHYVSELIESEELRVRFRLLDPDGHVIEVIAG